MSRKLMMKLSLRFSKIRNEDGFHLVELIVSIGIISLLIVAIMDSLAQVHRQESAAQNQILAANIAQELIDDARNANWNVLKSNLGTQTLLVNKTSLSQTGTFLNPRPLMLDLTGSHYSQEGSSNLFYGTVQQTITDIGNNQLRLAINVSWPSESGQGTRQLQMSTVISQYGIHN